MFALQGAEQIGAMWQMVCQTIRNGGQAVWRLETHEVEAAGGERGSARWEARYRSGAAGRMVHNVVEAEFTFEDGLIVTHAESYDFWRWSRQALGSTGLMMGWTPMLRNQVRRQAQGKLERFLAHRAAATAQPQPEPRRAPRRTGRASRAIRRVGIAALAPTIRAPRTGGLSCLAGCSRSTAISRSATCSGCSAPSAHC